MAVEPLIQGTIKSLHNADLIVNRDLQILLRLQIRNCLSLERMFSLELLVVFEVVPDQTGKFVLFMKTLLYLPRSIIFLSEIITCVLKTHVPLKTPYHFKVQNYPIFLNDEIINSASLTCLKEQTKKYFTHQILNDLQARRKHFSSSIFSHFGK